MPGPCPREYSSGTPRMWPVSGIVGRMTMPSAATSRAMRMPRIERAIRDEQQHGDQEEDEGADGRWPPGEGAAHRRHGVGEEERVQPEADPEHVLEQDTGGDQGDQARRA